MSLEQPLMVTLTAHAFILTHRSTRHPIVTALPVNVDYSTYVVGGKKLYISRAVTLWAHVCRYGSYGPPRAKVCGGGKIPDILLYPARRGHDGFDSGIFVHDERIFTRQQDPDFTLESFGCRESEGIHLSKLIPLLLNVLKTSHRWNLYNNVHIHGLHCLDMLSFIEWAAHKKAHTKRPRSV
jgi:hypothetical protein